MSTIRTLTRRAEEMFALIERYNSSSLNRKVFCAQNGVAYSTFQWWLHQYRHREKTSGARDSPINDFVPIHLTPPHRHDAFASACRIEYPNGVVISFREVNVKVLADLTALQAD